MMNTKLFAIGLAAALALFALPAFAQDATPETSIPAVCNAGMKGMASTEVMGGMDTTVAMDVAHQDLMKGMGAMNAQMNEGMLAPDIDVAFVCGMLPHHQGAIDMAKAELKYGKDPFTRKLAMGIIAAQEKEIAEMKDWLSKHVK
jgi:uncharacterized protein (DUF305 family)